MYAHSNFYEVVCKVFVCLINTTFLSAYWHLRRWVKALYAAFDEACLVFEDYVCNTC